MSVIDHIARNFSFEELTDSENHPDLVPANRAWVYASAQRIASLTAIAAMLQEVRDEFGVIKVHSGARSPSLNNAVGGRPDSQHLLCEAVDFHARDAPLVAVYDWIVKESRLLYGQCLIEGPSGAPGWIHLSLGEPWRPASRSRDHHYIDPATNKRISAG